MGLQNLLTRTQHFTFIVMHRTALHFVYIMCYFRSEFALGLFVLAERLSNILNLEVIESASGSTVRDIQIAPFRILTHLHEMIVVSVFSCLFCDNYNKSVSI